MSSIQVFSQSFNTLSLAKVSFPPKCRQRAGDHGFGWRFPSISGVKWPFKNVPYSCVHYDTDNVFIVMKNSWWYLMISMTCQNNTKQKLLLATAKTKVSITKTLSRGGIWEPGSFNLFLRVSWHSCNLTSFLFCSLQPWKWPQSVMDKPVDSAPVHFIIPNTGVCSSGNIITWSIGITNSFQDEVFEKPLGIISFYWGVSQDILIDPLPELITALGFSVCAKLLITTSWTRCV